MVGVLNFEERCVGCRHKRHRKTCTEMRNAWWTRKQIVCACTYWDSRWEIDDLYERIAELEKQNAELRRQLPR